MNSLGMPCNQSEVMFLLKEMDKDASGHIDFEEFHNFVSKPGPVSNKLKKRFKAKIVRFRTVLRNWAGREISTLANQLLVNEARADAREAARKAMLEEERLKMGLPTSRTEKSTKIEDVRNHSLSERLSRLTAVETSAWADGNSYSRTHRGRRELATRQSQLSQCWEAARNTKASFPVAKEDNITGHWFFKVHKSPWLQMEMDRQELKYLAWHLTRHWGSVAASLQPNMLQQMGFDSSGEYQPNEEKISESQVVDSYSSVVADIRAHLGMRHFMSSLKKGQKRPNFASAGLKDLIAELRCLGRSKLDKELDPVDHLGIIREVSSGVEESKVSEDGTAFSGGGAESLDSVEELHRHIQENVEMKQVLAEAETVAMEEAEDFLKTKAGKRELKTAQDQVSAALAEIERDGWLSTRVLNPNWAVLEEGDDIEKELLSKAFALLSRDQGRGPQHGVDRNEVPFMFEFLGVQQEVLGNFIYNLEQFILKKNGEVDDTTKSLHTKLIDATSNEVLVFEEVIQLYERLRATLGRSEFVKLMYKQKKASKKQVLKKMTKCFYMSTVREKARRAAFHLDEDSNS